MPVRNIQILVVVVMVCLACYLQAERLKYGGKIGRNIQLIEENFVKEVDPDELYVAAMQGVVSKLDEHSEFIPPARYEEFQSVIEQQFGGIGVLIEGPPAVEQLTVVTPILGTPAFEAGMQPGDVIVKIDETSTEGLEATDATGLMRGPVGKPVRLKVRRETEPELLTMDIARADIQVDSIYGDRIKSDSTWDYFLQEDRRIAYVRITLFGERTVGEFRRVLEEINGRAKAIVLDLRYNPGGVLPAAVEMCDMLVDQGVIVSTKGRREYFASSFDASPDTELDVKIPMVLLVNGQSASSSEIMAGCLQDLGRAKVAGSRSYGKGTVQQVFELENDSTALKFTTAKFYRPSGKNINRDEEMTADDVWGVSPDEGLELKLTDRQQIQLNWRWRQLGDPRITSARERPPEPPLAGDPQLRLVLKYLQELLDGDQ